MQTTNIKFKTANVSQIYAQEPAMVTVERNTFFLGLGLMIDNANVLKQLNLASKNGVDG